MKTKVLPTADSRDFQQSVETGARLLKQGHIIAFPTETVYGLGADMSKESSVKKVFKAKNRPADNPVIVHIADMKQVKQVASRIPKRAKILMKKFWPGPLSIVLPKHDDLSDVITAGLDTVVVRFPSHPVALELIRTLGNPIVAPSANTSGKVSPTRAEHVLEDLEGKIPLIIDAGEIEYGLESTVIDCTTKETIILRPGSITIEMIQKLISEARLHTSTDKQSSPGMKYRHYATKAPIVLFRGMVGETTRTIQEYLTSQNNSKTILLWHTGDFSKLPNNIKLPANPFEAGPLIFNTLRSVDQKSVDQIIIQGYTYEDMGQAIMNRLEKAASEIIDV